MLKLPNEYERNKKKRKTDRRCCTHTHTHTHSKPKHKRGATKIKNTIEPGMPVCVCSEMVVQPRTMNKEMSSNCIIGRRPHQYQQQWGSVWQRGSGNTAKEGANVYCKFIIGYMSARKHYYLKKRMQSGKSARAHILTRTLLSFCERRGADWSDFRIALYVSMCVCLHTAHCTGATLSACNAFSSPRSLFQLRAPRERKKNAAENLSFPRSKLVFASLFLFRSSCADSLGWNEK